MPTRIATPCRTPGCPRAGGPSGHCPPHARSRDRARGSASQRGYGAAHQAWRAAILARDPLCRICHTAPPTVADHVRPLRQGGGWSYSNGQGLCERCHNRKRATTDRGR